MSEKTPQPVLDARGNRRQFFEFLAGAGTGTAVALFTNSNETNAYSSATLQDDTQVDKKDTETNNISMIAGGATGLVVGYSRGDRQAEIWLDRVVKEGKAKTVEDKQLAKTVVTPLYRFSGAALGGVLGAGLGHSAGRLIKKIF